ncbi:hypothetical protein CBM2623_A150027 [Cupriavidus taiwanensis]|nr:hypothetical protein CBM2608_A150027 [Cupriavidus taiwanensis]SPA25773.1 hypothetical protein CBM2623_A150027 [Cupriavidus taiwanensis]
MHRRAALADGNGNPPQAAGVGRNRVSTQARGCAGAERAGRTAAAVACVHRWWQGCRCRPGSVLVALWLGLLLGAPAPALAVSCTLNLAATSNQQTVYGFTAADYAACDPNQFTIAYDAAGTANFGTSTRSTPTAQGGTLYIYNGQLPNGQNENGFVYMPPAGFVGTDSATFFTSDDGATWAPNGTVNFNVSAGPPTVTAVTPSSGPTSGGTAVTVTGTNFVGVTAVRFGGTAASFVVNGATSLTATAPARPAGTVDITVTTAGGTSATSAADQFTFVSGPPVANSVSATVAYGSAGNAITLNLTGAAATSVAVGSSPAHGTAIASGTSITYTPTSSYAGPDSFTYTATNASGTSAPATVTITVSSPTLIYAPSSPPPGSVGGAYSQSLAVASGGSGPYTYTLASGALPPGMTLSSAGLLAGTPTAGGTFNFTVRATDSSSGTGPFSAASGTLSLVLGGAAMSLSPAPGPLSATAGSPYSQAFTAGGGTGPYSYSITINGGTMPAGLAFNSASGVLAGTPRTAGTVSFTIQANDSSTGTGPYSVAGAYALTIAAPTVMLSPATLVNPALGVAYSQSVSASGGSAPYTYSVVAGALPPGLTLNGSTGAVAGTTVAGGNYNFTIQATDNLGFTGSRAYSLALGAPTIVINPATLPQATVAAAYSQALTATSGTAPYTFAITAGALPAGMSLSAGGVLAGTPSGGGTHHFTVSATDSSAGTGPYTGSQAYTLTVSAPALTLSPASLHAPVSGVAYSQAFTAGGGTAPYTFCRRRGNAARGAVAEPVHGCAERYAADGRHADLHGARDRQQHRHRRALQHQPRLYAGHGAGHAFGAAGGRDHAVQCAGDHPRRRQCRQRALCGRQHRHAAGQRQRRGERTRHHLYAGADRLGPDHVHLCTGQQRRDLGAGAGDRDSQRGAGSGGAETGVDAGGPAGCGRRDRRRQRRAVYRRRDRLGGARRGRHRDRGQRRAEDAGR